MATNLPILSVTDPQAARILDAFKARYGTTTQAETVRAYKQWLAGEVRAVVVTFEASRIDETHNSAKRNELAALEASLPDPATIL